MKKLFPLALVAILFVACNKEDNQSAPAVASSFEELTVSKDFNWSASKQVQLTVQLKDHQNAPMDLSGGMLWIIDENEARIATAKINAQEKAEFSLLAPASAANYRIFLPATGDSWPLDWTDNQEVNLPDPLNNPNLNSNKYMGKQAALNGTPPGTNLFGNDDFETTISIDDVGYNYHPGTGTIGDGKWIVTDTEYSQPTVNGSKVFKVDNNRWTHLWQLHNVNAGDSIYLHAEDFSGEVRAYLFFYTSAGSTNSMSFSYKTLSSNDKTIGMVVPTGATVVSALFNLYDNAWIDNVFLSNPAAITDTDGDGVADEDDDFPNDPTRAYLSYFPTAGRQTIAYEDMWPVQGDYDFNDMVISLESTLTKDGDGNWVTAEYEIALDAFGGGIESGLALRLTDAAKANFGSSIIASVSGDASLDPNVTNGIIVFNDPDAVRSQYYNNTEAGLMSTPDTLRFTITFASNDGSAFLNDFYIFHKEERGREIHLSGFSGTSAADANLYNTGDDVNGTYKTATGLPWAMDIVLDGENFQHPMEKIDMITAYPKFSLWAGSAGASNSDWYQTPNIGDVVDLLGL